MTTPTPLCDLLDHVLRGEAHRSNAPSKRGGEWDAWFALPQRSRRRLIGARWARFGALPPDVLADRIRDVIAVDDPLVWFYRTALAAIDERQRAANVDRHVRVAVDGGDVSYYARRTRLVQQVGHPSLWHYRVARGWSVTRVHGERLSA